MYNIYIYIYIYIYVYTCVLYVFMGISTSSETRRPYIVYMYSPSKNSIRPDIVLLKQGGIVTAAAAARCPLARMCFSPVHSMTNPRVLSPGIPTPADSPGLSLWIYKSHFQSRSHACLLFSAPIFSVPINLGEASSWHVVGARIFDCASACT